MSGPGHVICEENSQVICVVHFCQDVVVQVVKASPLGVPSQDMAFTGVELHTPTVSPCAEGI